MRLPDLTGAWRKQLDESGQMAVELAIVTPVILVVLVIALDLFVFLDECARFENVAAQVLLAQAGSPARDQADADACSVAAQQTLSSSFSHEGERVEVAHEPGSGRTCVYTCTLHLVPWPFTGSSLGVFGLRVPPELTHSCRLALDAYIPGKL
jgi:hypothetical protein